MQLKIIAMQKGLLIKNYWSQQYGFTGDLAQVFRTVKNCLGLNIFWLKTKSFFETRKQFRASHSNVWEPGENPGRLRHCNGYKFQVHWSKTGKAERGLKPKSGYRLDCARQPRTFRGTSPQREGWGQPADLFSAGLVEFHLHSSFAKTGGFLLSGFALVSQFKSVPGFRPGTS